MLTSPGGCDKTGMEPFSGREIWPPANVNVLEELMHRTLICSSSARWRHVWEKGRVYECISNTPQVPRKLRGGLLLWVGGNQGTKTFLFCYYTPLCEEMGTHLVYSRAFLGHPSVFPPPYLPQTKWRECVHCADEKVEVRRAEIIVI